jgi:transposase
MTIVAGFDVHRAQITFDALDQETGELHRGRIPATPDAVREWVKRFPGREIHVAVEACTGWLFVCQALEQQGAIAHLAEPTETAARRGKKRRAKTDRADARHLRTLLVEDRLPESWMPPAHVREWRTRTRLRKTLIDERTAWLARVQATLFHHGIGSVPERLLCAEGREFLDKLDLPPAALERIEVAMAIVDAIDRQMAPIERGQLSGQGPSFAHRKKEWRVGGRRGFPRLDPWRWKGAPVGGLCGGSGSPPSSGNGRVTDSTATAGSRVPPRGLAASPGRAA